MVDAAWQRYQPGDLHALEVGTPVDAGLDDVGDALVDGVEQGLESGGDPPSDDGVGRQCQKARCAVRGLGDCGAAFSEVSADVAKVLPEEGVRRRAGCPRLGATGVGSVRENREPARQPLLGVDDEPKVHRSRERLEADEQVGFGLEDAEDAALGADPAVCGCGGASRCCRRRSRAARG